jgi:hypothetical protein
MKKILISLIKRMGYTVYSKYELETLADTYVLNRLPVSGYPLNKKLNDEEISIIKNHCNDFNLWPLEEMIINKNNKL